MPNSDLYYILSISRYFAQLSIYRLIDISNTPKAWGTLGGEWLPMGGQARPVLIHVLLQRRELVPAVDQKPDEFGKL